LPDTAYDAPGLTGFVTVVGAQISKGHVQQGLVKLAILTTELHLASRIDVEEFAASQTFPGRRLLPGQHLLSMLLVQVHASKEVMLGQEAPKLVSLQRHAPVWRV
jgi:hypothetical protein